MVSTERSASAADGRSRPPTSTISPARSRVGIALNVAIVVIELVFGLLANSMALISDAGHNLSDVLGLVVGWAGGGDGQALASPRFTYGLKKARSSRR